MKAAVFYEIGGPEVFSTRTSPIRSCGPAGCSSRSPRSASRAATCCTAPAACWRPTPARRRLPGGRRRARGRRRRRPASPSVDRSSRRWAPARTPSSSACRRRRRGAVPDGLVARGGRRHPDRVRHRRRLPVRVRPPAGGRDRAGAGGRRRRRPRRDPAGEGGRARRCSPPRRATTGSSASHDYGMDHGINYAHGDVAREVRALTDGRGVDLVVDPVGGRTLEGSIARARLPRPDQLGRPAPAGTSAPPEVWPLMQKNGSLTGVFLGAEMVVNPTGARHDRLADPALCVRRAAGRHRPHLPARRRRRGPPLHREPPAFGRVLLIP